MCYHVIFDVTERTPSSSDSPTIQDFEIVKNISNGAYGSVILSCQSTLRYRNVVLVRKKTSGKLFAMKDMKKSVLRMKNMAEHGQLDNHTDHLNHIVATERDALAHANNPFIVRLFYSFATKTDMYLVCG